MESVRSQEEMASLYRRHVDMVYQLCLVLMKNVPDAEDATQTVFRKVMEYGKPFRDHEHEKAWLIVTAANACKDALKHWWRRGEDLASCQCLAEDVPFEIDGVLSAILALPPDYKEAVYLYYCEGYSTPEIAKMLHRPQSTVRSRLARARKLLEKSVWEGGETHDKSGDS